MLYKFAAISINGGTRNNYIELFSGDTSGQSYDALRVLWTEFATSTVTSVGYISIIINGSTYYIRTYVGSTASGCCSNIIGVDTTGSFTSLGFALIWINKTDLRYIQIYSKDEVTI